MASPISKANKSGPLRALYFLLMYAAGGTYLRLWVIELHLLEKLVFELVPKDLIKCRKQTTPFHFLNL